MVNQHTQVPEPLDEPMYIHHPDPRALQSVGVGDMIATRESAINEHGQMEDRVRHGLVTSVRTNSDGMLASVASIECYQYSSEPVRVREDQWVLSAGKCESHTLDALSVKAIGIHKRVVPTDWAAGDLKNRDIRDQIESSITHRKDLESNKYFVYRESALGYMRAYDSEPAYFAGPQHLFILSARIGDAMHLIDAEKVHLRPATVKDFATYRVSLPPDFYYEQTYSGRDDMDRPDIALSDTDKETVKFLRDCKAIIHNAHPDYDVEQKDAAYACMQQHVIAKAQRENAADTKTMAEYIKNYPEYYATYSGLDRTDVEDVAMLCLKYSGPTLKMKH